MQINNRDFLEELNQVLENHVNYTNSGEAYPNIFIIGAPRSGTTLLTQLLTFTTEAGYIDNLTAAFWKAPEVGALLSKKLVNRRIFSGQSAYGQTRDISEPHEFGGFWRHFLNYPDTAQIQNHQVDWQRLIQKLDNISRVFGASVIYKVFQLMWHIREFHALKPDSKWIWITRDPGQNASSIARYRDHLGTDEQQWASVVPLKSRAFDQADALTKCASQVIYINEWINTELQSINKVNWCQVSLEDLQRDPDTELSKLGQLTGLSINPEKLTAVRSQLSKVQKPLYDERLPEIIHNIQQAAVSSA